MLVSTSSSVTRLSGQLKKQSPNFFGKMFQLLADILKTSTKRMNSIMIRLLQNLQQSLIEAFVVLLKKN